MLWNPDLRDLERQITLRRDRTDESAKIKKKQQPKKWVAAFALVRIAYFLVENFDLVA